MNLVVALAIYQVCWSKRGLLCGFPCSAAWEQLCGFPCTADQESTDFKMKLMDINSEHPEIPKTEYEAIVRMPSAKFARICKDLSTIGDTGSPVVFYGGFVICRYLIGRVQYGVGVQIHGFLVHSCGLYLCFYDS